MQRKQTGRRQNPSTEIVGTPRKGTAAHYTLKKGYQGGKREGVWGHTREKTLEKGGEM